LDYEVFMLARTREAHVTGPTDEAIELALAGTGSLMTSAGLRRHREMRPDGAAGNPWPVPLR
jgi:hypothetical protein